MLAKLIWPLPALLVWALAWLVFAVLLQVQQSALLALAIPSCLGVAFSTVGKTWWRRLFIGLGFPLSLATSGILNVPSWFWLVPFLLLLAVYPLNAWRDAPIFPTPADALNELPEVAPLLPGARVLDAGCGLGHGLEALRQAYPLAQFQGIEWSRPLRWWCARRCPWARVEQGDIWQADWSEFDLVYLFQRPESMARAFEKAHAEMRSGAYLVSLEFEVEGVNPLAKIEGPGMKPVWVYRMSRP